MAEERIIRFMRFSKPMAVASLLVVLAGVVSLFVHGLNLGQDFTGGTTAEINYLQPVDQEAVRAALEGVLARFEHDLFAFVESKHPKLLEEIATQRQLSDDLKGRMSGIIEDFKKVFVK